MVMSWLKRIYTSCELKLKSVRDDLLYHVKQVEGFLFHNHDMKKRLQTKNGELLVDKLCKDIYMLVSVLEGEDVNST